MTEQITDAVRARLAELESDGRLTPAVVVEDAKSESSPLHGLFEWDADKAAYHHWLHTARIIIKSVRYIPVEETVTVVRAPQYVRDPDAPPKSQGYISVAELRNDPVTARASMRLEFGRVESALERARSVAVAIGLENEIEQLIAHVVRVREHAAAA